MKKSQVTENQQKGFTLIELSIVLVIIGLIVGGVLVGQDLIKAAEVRATVSQVEKYNSAINTFRSKYNGIPGDIVSTTATAFGLYSGGMDGSTGKGDGNGVLEGSATGAEIGVGENLVFWRHLSDANLVDGSYGSDLTTVDPTSTTPGTYFPAAKLGRGNYFIASSSAGLNYYFLTGITTVSTAGAYTFAADLTPIEAYNMDIKMDDGAPLTGVVQAHGTASSSTAFLTDPSNWAASPAAGNCVTTGSSGSDPADTYNRGLTTGGDSPGCQIRFRFN